MNTKQVLDEKIKKDMSKFTALDSLQDLHNLFTKEIKVIEQITNKELAKKANVELVTKVNSEVYAQPN